VQSLDQRGQSYYRDKLAKRELEAHHTDPRCPASPAEHDTRPLLMDFMEVEVSNATRAYSCTPYGKCVGMLITNLNISLVNDFHQFKAQDSGYHNQVVPPQPHRKESTSKVHKYTSQQLRDSQMRALPDHKLNKHFRHALW